MDLVALRRLLEPLVVNIVATHRTLPSLCERLSLPPPPEEGSKRERLRASFQAVGDADLPRVAAHYIDSFAPAASLRNSLQDLLWADDPGPAILKRYRHELAESLDPSDLYVNRPSFDRLLNELFILDDDPMAMFKAIDRSLRAQIEKHVHENRGDWSTTELFEKLGAFACSDRRFRLLLEGLVSPSLRPDEQSQRRVVQRMNFHLRAARAELRETNTDGGYPLFSVVSLANVSTGRPKNLIFASSVKPDIRFRDAINNDIEIVTNADKVLIYDRPISADGLRWRELQAWWADLRMIPNDGQAKRTLYSRLKSSLPTNSPPQMLLFEEFFKVHGSRVPELPALLPEVWLHWDAKTVKERGSTALAQSRMDNLMLLPGNVRIVIEVDGKHHYSDDDGQANAAKYAMMQAADRELRLAGYEVFRFGGRELDGDAGRRLVKDFFAALFKRYNVT